MGWVRHAFDTFEVPFDLIYKERVRQGGLRSAYDVILIPNQGRGSAKSLVYDVESKGKPLAYKKSDAFTTLGVYGESDDITGGMGLEGVARAAEIRQRRRRARHPGGIELSAAGVRAGASVNAQRPTSQFYAPGPIVQAEIVRPSHPIFYGYVDKKIPVRYGNGPLLQVPQTDEGQVLMRYPGGDAGVLSGLMRDANEISNRPAIVDTPAGKGRVIMFAGNPCYRWQNHGEFAMLFNSVMHWNDRPPSRRQPTAAPVSTPAQGR